MAEKQTPEGLIVGMIPEEKPQKQPMVEEKPIASRGRKPKTDSKD